MKKMKKKTLVGLNDKSLGTFVLDLEWEHCKQFGENNCWSAHLWKS